MHYVYEETQSLDNRCYEHFSLTPEILMEHAALALVRAIKKRITCKDKILFVCGTGNNGADGIAAARMMHGAYDVSLYLPFELTSALALQQKERAQKAGVPIVHEIIDANMYVDALFGSGLNRPLNAQSCAIIETLNAQKGYKIACDVPSGLMPSGVLTSVVFRADETITMGAMKIALLHDYAKDVVGKIHVANLGISRTLYELPSSLFVLQKHDLKLPIRTHKNANKGTFGHVAVVCGNKEGAALLASQGAFRFGAGLVSLIGEKPKKLPAYLMHANALPTNTSVIVAGMGLETFNEDSMKEILLSHTLPLVIDASLSHHPFIKTLIDSKKPLVLTPHPKEFSSILKITCNEQISAEKIQEKRFYYAKTFSQTFPHLVLLLKGANTIIAHQGELYINPWGTQALAKGGSGDVLSGMIGALIAQGYTLKDAAIQASLAHALAARKFTCNNFALTPIDICKGLKWL